MAERRMFAIGIIDNDAFLDMPLSAQSLYFHLSMRADDDGFINKPKGVMRLTGAAETDLEVLIERNFILFFREESVALIKYWRMSNTISKDRYKETVYKDLKARLFLDENQVYILLASAPQEIVPAEDMDIENPVPGSDAIPIHSVTNPSTDCIQPVTDPLPQIRLDKIRLDKEKEFLSAKAEGAVPAVSEKQSLPESPQPKKKSKPPLTEREPENDYERIEKRYLENWRKFYQQGKVKTEFPVVNWGQSRALLKNFLPKFQVDQIASILDKAAVDDWILSKGYTLSVILSSTVFNRLLNGSEFKRTFPAAARAENKPYISLTGNEL